MAWHSWPLSVKTGGKALSKLLALGLISGLSIASTSVAENSATQQIKEKQSHISTGNKQSAKLGKFSVVYQRSSNPLHQQLQAALQKGQLFEKIAYSLNSSKLVMRVDIPIILQDCDHVNAFYSPRQHTITICNEFIVSAVKDFKRLKESSIEEAIEQALYATIFAFYHELGHALVDVLQLPAVGQEEDVVDEFAAIILLKSDTPETAQVVAYGAIWFGSQPQGPFWDEHAPGDKRFFNLLCLIYGSNPRQYAPIMETVFKAQNVEPEAFQRRAALCQQEYPQKVARWEKLLLPHFAQGRGSWGRSNGTTTYPSPGNNTGGRRRW